MKQLLLGSKNMEKICKFIYKYFELHYTIFMYYNEKEKVEREREKERS